MEKINGFCTEEVKRLIEFIETGKKRGASLSALFEQYGNMYGRAKGSVRNFYYQLLKQRNANNKVKTLLAGKNFKAEKIIEFTPQETTALIKDILKGKGQGKSVRSVIREVAKGEEKLMLRLQNKYRNVLKNQPDLIESAMTELKDELGEDYFAQKTALPAFSDFAVKRLQQEINNLYNKLNESLKKENKTLREKLMRLENENLRLKLLTEDNNIKEKNKSRFYFERNTDKHIIS